MKVCKHTAILHIVPIDYGNRTGKFFSIVFFRIYRSRKTFLFLYCMVQIICVILRLALENRIINIRTRYPNPSIHIWIHFLRSRKVYFSEHRVICIDGYLFFQFFIGFLCLLGICFFGLFCCCSFFLLIGSMYKESNPRSH